MSDNGGSNNFLYFLSGLAIGAVVALLYAPQSGEKTRKLIGKKAEAGKEFLREAGSEFREQAEDFVIKGREMVSEQVERSRDLVSQQVERGKDLVAKQKDQLSAALEAVKEGYKEAKRAH